MREYELTVLIHPDLEADLEPALKKVRDIIAANKGVVKKEDNWGKKRLQYTIAKQDFAVYVYFEIKLPAEATQKLDGTLNITSSVIRHLLIKVNPKRRAALEAQAETSAKEEE